MRAAGSCSSDLVFKREEKSCSFFPSFTVKIPSISDNRSSSMFFYKGSWQQSLPGFIKEAGYMILRPAGNVSDWSFSRWKKRDLRMEVLHWQVTQHTVCSVIYAKILYECKNKSPLLTFFNALHVFFPLFLICKT